MRTSYQWREQGEGAASDDWRAGNRSETTDADIESALSAHYAEDLATADITEQSDEAQALALAAMIDGYVAEYRRLGGVVVYATSRCGICVHHVGGHGCVRPSGHDGPCRAPLHDADGLAVEAGVTS